MNIQNYNAEKRNEKGQADHGGNEDCFKIIAGGRKI